MSQANSNKQTAVQADEGSVASRTRKKARVRPRDEAVEEIQHGQQPPAQSSAHVSPAMRIYRHAFEAIFGMLNLADLSRALAVSRAWSAAVRSMAPINAAIQRGQFRPFVGPLPPLANLVVSPLLRHVAALDVRCAGPGWTPLVDVSLAFLTQHAPNLTSLGCVLTRTSSTEPLILPAKLTSLELRTYRRHTCAANNGVLTAAAALPALSRLHLRLKAFQFKNSIELSLLAAFPSLLDLTLETRYGESPNLSDAQFHQIRSSLGTLQRISFGEMDSDMLARLLQLPVTARWRDIGQVYADERTGKLLLRLPSLTQLDLWYAHHTAQVDFLSQLPLLVSLKLDCHWSLWNQWFIPADGLLSSLVLCQSLTELDLSCGFSSEQWPALFAKLTIRKLTIRHAKMQTLPCFTAGPITQSLEDLSLVNIDRELSYLWHLSGLRRLRILRLERCFHPPPSQDDVSRLFPPTPILPALTELYIHGYDARKHIDRQCASFEWMQQRMTE